SGEQTTFNFTFIAPDEGRASEFTAFAVTSLLPANVLSLELDAARAPATGLASLRVTSVFVDGIAQAGICRGFCDASESAQLRGGRRDYFETTGIPDTDQIALAARASKDEINASAEIDGGYVISALTETTSEIVLRCKSSGNGTGVSGESDIDNYFIDASSTNIIRFKIEGERRVRYKFSVESSVSNSSPFTDAFFTGGVRNIFEMVHTTLEGRSQTGQSSGFLEAGSEHELRTSCGADVEREGGSASSDGVMHFTLSPE
ncbi:hypothetical protein, partial [Stenotrophobium rhamnosiphilum]